MKKNNRNLLMAGMGLAAAYLIMDVVAKKLTEPEDIDADNQYLHVFNNEGKQESEISTGLYESKVKPALDKVLSFGGLVLLSPFYAVISFAVFIDDPGPVLFTQKRVGKDKHFFMLHKYRSMKVSTPHDVPTHLLADSESYITRVGRVLRRTSLDELPQIWDIFRGKMSVIGPRPALWNQDDLVKERFKYGANTVVPGLTGLAQIKGRDELLIPDKAKLDGAYVKVLRKGGLRAFFQDVSCFFSTVAHVVKHDGVVEGGTGSLTDINDAHQMKTAAGVGVVDASDVGFEEYGYLKHFHIDKTVKKRVLITGANSYIGESLCFYAAKHYPTLTIDTVDMTKPSWREFDFASYDTVFHVAGIAHADIGKVIEERKAKYYAINTDLAIETATVAKNAGVSQFLFMSSMIVYGDSASYGKDRIIDEHTIPAPANFYGDSKWQADKGVRALCSPVFSVAVLRAPMIYGRGSKGNYPMLAKLAKRLPLFPNVENQRSMLYVENLCEFLCQLICSGEGGIYFPQNKEYSATAQLVKEIGKVSGRPVHTTGILNPAVRFASHVPGKVSRLADKAFGNCVYSQRLSTYEGLDYRVTDLRESIRLTEGKIQRGSASKNALIVTSVASMIDQFTIPNIRLLISLGYDVDVATNFRNGSTCTDEKIQELIILLDRLAVDCYHIDFDRKVTNLKADAKAFKQLDAVVMGDAKPINAARHHQIHSAAGVKYHFIHSHSPIGGVVGRIVAKKHGIQTIYTAHGFHFYNGAPKKNWLLFYPIERELSRITDVLITINREDYRRAAKQFHAKKTVYIPGVGVDIEKFRNAVIDRDAKRAELGIDKTDLMLLSVGELNRNKNQKMVIQALGEMEPNDSCRLHYFIAGKGELQNELMGLANELHVNLHLLGFRQDIAEIIDAADIFVHVSKREGLPVSLMEAMAAGIPAIVTDIRGNTDLVRDGQEGRVVDGSVAGLAKALADLSNNQLLRKQMGKNASLRIRQFDVNKVNRFMSDLYSDNSGGGYLKVQSLINRWRIRKELSIPFDAFVLLSIGELNDNKNHGVIIKAMNELRSEDIHYIICGKGENADTYQSMIDDYNLQERVHLAGYQDDVRPYHACADVFVFPSHREGLGLSALEAMAYGLPMISSNVGGIKDYSKNGETGFVVEDETDFVCFAQKIMEMKLNPEKYWQMSKAAASAVLHYSQSRVNIIMKKNYEEIRRL